MAADKQGNDITKVGVPIGGTLYIAGEEVKAPTLVELKAGTIPETYIRAGLITKDGGFELSIDNEEGEEFLNEGYRLPGEAKLSITFSLAEDNAVCRELRTGVKDTENGVAVDVSGNPKIYKVITAEAYKNGSILFRSYGRVMVDSWKETKTERGKIKAYEFTLRVSRSAECDGKHFLEVVKTA